MTRVAILKSAMSAPLLATAMAAFQPTAAFAQACIQVPVDCRVTSAFGGRFNPTNNTFSTEFHHGIDFGCPIGTPDRAAEGGVVAVAGSSESAGNWIVIHAAGGKVVYKYMHHARLEISKGTMVNAGQLIAYTGNTGRSTGPHLHFQVEVAGVAVDPYARFCTKPPLKAGVLQGADAPETDLVGAGTQATAPGDSGGIPPAMGMDGSVDQVMADVIASRALNPDYAQQLATISEPRLYAEISYMQAIRLKLRHERALHRERMLASSAMIQTLMTEATLRPQLAAQRTAATKTSLGASK